MTSTGELTAYDLPMLDDDTTDGPEKDMPSSVIRPLGAPSSIKPIARQTPRVGEDLLPQGLKPGATWVACPNCFIKNKINEVFCYTCGHLMDGGQGFNVTRSFADANVTEIKPEFYGKDSLLILQVRDSGAYFKLRPQNYNNELVVGRSSSNNAMRPDVDLIEENAEDLGVSRLHLALQYLLKDDTIVVFDLGSANGSFINGQKLHPLDKRVLQNGDDIRLGRLVIRVKFEHPGPEL